MMSLFCEGFVHFNYSVQEHICCNPVNHLWAIWAALTSGGVLAAWVPTGGAYSNKVWCLYWQLTTNFHHRNGSFVCQAWRISKVTCYNVTCLHTGAAASWQRPYGSLTRLRLSCINMIRIQCSVPSKYEFRILKYLSKYLYLSSTTPAFLSETFVISLIVNEVITALCSRSI